MIRYLKGLMIVFLISDIAKYIANHNINDTKQAKNSKTVNQYVWYWFPCNAGNNKSKSDIIKHFF